MTGIFRISAICVSKSDNRIFYPRKILSKVSIKQLRVYFTAENLCYWSPIKKHSKYIDPEAAFSRTSNQLNAMYYPWAKTYMFGIDITL